MPVTSLVNYPKATGIFYITLNSHADHAPTKVTRNGKIWEKKLYDQYKKILKPNDIAIDVGGYIGSHTLPMSRFCSEVYVFEPNADLFQVINSNIELNKFQNIKSYNIALGKSNEDVDFYERENGTSRIAKKNILGNTVYLSSLGIDPRFKVNSVGTVPAALTTYDLLDKKNFDLVNQEIFSTKLSA